MASVNDQFDQGRIPIKVLPYSLARNNAQADELIIDYLPETINDNPSYHIYIADHNNPENLIDITNLIIKEIFPNAKIDASKFQIFIEGVNDTVSLKDIINFIYKRFIFPDNINGFNYTTDYDKLFEQLTVPVLLTNIDNTILLPVTTTDNVYDKYGRTLEDRLSNASSRIGFSVAYVRATVDNQTEFIFDYPFEGYSDFIEIRIGGTYISKDLYSITNITDNGVTKGKITFLNNKSIEENRRIDIIFIYNAKAVSSSNYEYIYGHTIADNSLPSSKLEKISDSYSLNDPTSVASSAAVYKLFIDVLDNIHRNNMALLWGIDSDVANTLTFNTTFDLTTGSIITLTVLKAKNSISQISINSNQYILKDIYGANTIISIPAGTTLKLLIDISDTNNRIAYILSENINKTKKVQSVYTCTSVTEGATRIPYNFNSNNDPTSDIFVYRNGVRLFENIDYVLNNDNSITLEVRVNGPSSSSPLSEGERIVFETNRLSI